MDRIKCSHCGTDMQFVGAERIQLGQAGWILGALSNLISGALEVGIYLCPTCRKLEFFSIANQPNDEDALPQVVCPSCGKSHDFDYAKCPFCKHEY